MLLDFYSLNLLNIHLCSALLFVFILNKKNFIYLIILDIIINGIPFITLLIVLLYYLNNNLFKYLKPSFINKFILIIIYYFIFNIILYSIFNYYNFYAIKITLNNLIYNLIIYYLGLKTINIKYT